MTRPAVDGPRSGSRLPVSRDRRPALAALALLLIVAGALGAALLVYRSGQRTDVLVAAHEITQGQQVRSVDFTTARISVDSGSVVHASSEGAFVGSYATTEIPAGTLLNNKMFRASNVLPSGGIIVGVTVSSGQRPASTVTIGNVVRAYYVAKSASSGSELLPGSVLAPAARVVGSAPSSSNSDSETVSLLVSSDQAAQLVAASAAGGVALALLPPGTKPEIDFKSGS